MDLHVEDKIRTILKLKSQKIAKIPHKLFLSISLKFFGLKLHILMMNKNDKYDLGHSNIIVGNYYNHYDKCTLHKVNSARMNRQMLKKHFGHKLFFFQQIGCSKLRWGSTGIPQTKNGSVSIRKLYKSLTKSNKMSMPWVVSTMAISRIVLGITVCLLFLWCITLADDIVSDSDFDASRRFKEI
ncbi:hypothetical protein AGLY_015510 [Aphis glycines]|uniref:Uncharacterized protein n=1 Tax=Aphis glycines TaxID=307491 RepID=A0A6G0T1B8_APHGL|nr:hypothetical protein AGLY_015510 [Aphis glycines]